MSKKQQHHEEHIDETWLIPYADLLTLLLALFIVLFATSHTYAKKFLAMRNSFSDIFKGQSANSLVDDPVDPDNISKYVRSPGTNDIRINAAAATPTPAPTPGLADGDGTLNANILLDEKMLEVKKRFDQYITEHNLQTQLHIVKTGLIVRITISDAILFDSGRADIKPAIQSDLQNMAVILADNPGLEVQILGHTDDVPINNSRFETNWDLSSARALAIMKILLQDQRLDPTCFSAIGYGEYHPVDTNSTPEGRAQNRRVEITLQY